MQASVGGAAGPGKRSGPARTGYSGRVGVFVHRLRVRYAECDPQGVVFNANYLVYFDVAHTEFWRAAVGPYQELGDSGVELVVADARCRFVAPARFDDELEIAVGVSRLGTTSITTRFKVRGPVGRVAEGEVRHVFVDALTNRKVAMPEHVRDRLGRHVVADAAAVEA